MGLVFTLEVRSCSSMTIRHFESSLFSMLSAALAYFSKVNAATADITIGPPAFLRWNLLGQGQKKAKFHGFKDRDR